MGIFSRIFKFAQAESHSVLDKLEDPIRMTEQGIRDLKKDLQLAMKSLAEVKASAIRMKKDGTEAKKRSEDYERKAMRLLQRAQGGQMEVAEADRLATEALSRKEETDKQAKLHLTNYKTQQKMADQLQAKVNKLKSSIGKYENELITLKARARTAESMTKINKQMSQVDSSSTVSMLERMKEKVNEQEALAEAYGELSDESMTIDEEIEKALESTDTNASDSLAELKAKMGIGAGKA